MPQQVASTQWLLEHWESAVQLVPFNGRHAPEALPPDAFEQLRPAAHDACEQQ